MKPWKWKEIYIYCIKRKGVTGEFAISIKHFKVTTEADNIFEEEQTLQVAKVIPVAPATAEVPANPNEETCMQLLMLVHKISQTSCMWT